MSMTSQDRRFRVIYGSQEAFRIEEYSKTCITNLIAINHNLYRVSLRNDATQKRQKIVVILGTTD
jgi:hypothetical protein